MTATPSIAASTPASPTPQPSSWYGRGDINAFFGLMLDNVGDMILMAGLLVGAFGMPSEFVLLKMIPGTAVGVLVGDLIFTLMGIQLTRKSRRSDVTAMPLGLDTPSTFGAVFLIIGPAYKAALGRGLTPVDAAQHAWFLGIAMILASGIFKLGCAPFSGMIRRALPRAGLLGSLTAIALVIISFLPLIDIAAQPVAGMISLALVLATLTAKWRLPRNFPGALAAVLAGCAVYYLMGVLGVGPAFGSEGSRPSASLRAVLPMPVHAWTAWVQQFWQEALGYLPVAIPLALATVVGGIDCTESAAAAGDDYHTGAIIAAEGFATVVGGLFGGVIQSTPYIGHPAYKAMGARSGYTLATAIFVGAAGILGFFDWIFYLIPKAAVFPILIFVGLEMTAQSFQATPKRHYAAVAFACVPALAYLALLALNQVLPSVSFESLAPNAQHWVQVVTILSGGFIVTSLIWGAGLAHLIDGRIRLAAGLFVCAAVFSWFGIIHSPVPSGPIVTPSNALARAKAEGRLHATKHQTPYHWAAAYASMAVVILLIGTFGKTSMDETTHESDVASMGI
ncbi:permease [Singulisphaera sp. PoT]|uniref:permease n=1 Tax=Singulisphaera sp. PoT TaxID=3411797 RepID=UPI003BF5E8E4